MSSEPFFVVNPNAANGKLGRTWPKVARMAERLLGPIRFALTEAQGHATQLAREAAEEGHELIVSCGGDGTNNEVINGLIKDDRAVREGIVMGMLPFGTGGDLRRVIGATGSIEQHLHRLKHGEDRVVDIGRIEYVAKDDGEPASRYFLNIASAGISGLVDQIVNSSSKRLGGKLSFLIASVRALREYKYPAVSVQVDDNPIMECPVSTVVVANGQFFGGGMHVAPEAQMDDGLFDVVVTQKASMWQSAIGLRDMYRGEHLKHPFVHHWRGRVVHVEPGAGVDEDVLLDVDGEMPGTCPATFEVVESAITLRVARGAL